MTLPTLAAAEFEHAFETLASLSNAVQKRLDQHDEVITQRVAGSLHAKLELRRTNLAKCRPTTKSATYDYATALPLLDTAADLLIDLAAIMESKPNSESTIERHQNPPLRLSSFTGDLTRYSAFKTAYAAAITKYRMTNSEKLLFLIQHLEGEPAKLLNGTQITDDNYDRAWTILDSWYGDNDRVISLLYTKLENLTPVRNPSSFRSQHIDITSILSSLRLHGENVDGQVRLRDIVLRKYPTTLIQQLCTDEFPSLATFQSKMDRYLAIRERVDASTAMVAYDAYENTHAYVHDNTSRAATAALFASSGTSTDKPKEKRTLCAFCKLDDHFSGDCKKYPTAEARRERIKGNCFNCLGSGHTLKQCRSRRTCYHCRGQHHSSLCSIQFPAEGSLERPGDQPGKYSSSLIVNATPTPTEETQTTNMFVRNAGTYMTVCGLVCNKETGFSKHVRIVFDSGCPNSLITQELAEVLQLKRSPARTIAVKGFLDKQPKWIKTWTTTISFPDCGRTIQAQTTPEIATNIQGTDHNVFLKHHPEYANLKFADEGNETNPDILIGGDHFFSFLADEPRITIEKSVHLVSTIFGWIIVGASNHSDQPRPYLLTITSALEELCALDTVGIRDAHLTAAEEQDRALKQFYRTINLQDGRYEVGWPWRINPANLPDNFALALGRLKTLHRSLQNNANLLKTYDDIFRQQIETGVLEEVCDPDKRTFVHYIPHQAVPQPEKSTPLRIVYDASMKTKKAAYSLNEAIYKGRPLLEDLIGVFIRSRQYPILLAADFEKAYLRIGLRAADRDYVRCLWLRDINEPPTSENLLHLRFTRTTFGVNAFAFILAATIAFHLAHTKNEIASQLQRSFYSDNLVTGADTTESATKLIKTLVDSFAECSMNLRAWITSSHVARASIPPGGAATKSPTSILGLLYNAARDEYGLAPPKLVAGTPTPRLILQNSSRVFDPLGFAAPVHLQAKLFMQAILTDLNEWDRPLPADLCKHWKPIEEDLTQLTSISVPRLALIHNETTLHIFCDASSRGYGFTIYQRDEAQGQVSINLIFAKARVTPRRKTTIPKLELLAASLAARATQFVVQHFRKPPPNKSTLWCDSKCTLARIYSSRMFSSYEERRLKEIRDAPNLTCRYVPSELNIADLASRGCTCKDLLRLPWFTGPQFLYLPPDQWPPFDPTGVHEFEPGSESTITRSANILQIIPEPRRMPFDLQPTDFPTFLKLIRVTSTLIRFLGYKSPTFAHKVGLNETNASTKATQWWIKAIQHAAFPTVFHDLENGKQNQLASKLSLCIDENGILRCRGRFKYAPLSDHEKQPILLPTVKHSYFVHLLILHYHTANFHVGTNHTLTAIRRSYWIINGRHSVFQTLRKCAPCSRYTARPYAQPSHSNLPLTRLQPSELPFERSAIDTTGPLYVDGHKKWILLATCLVTRAIVLEYLDTMQTADIYLAFRRFWARQTSPRYYYSDNAPQFGLMEKVVRDKNIHEVVWDRIAPGGSWAAGVYERLIAPVKQSLHRTFHGRSFSTPLFNTILLEIEATLNTRPITYVGPDHSFRPLTPADFLRSRYTVPAGDLSTSDHQQTLVTLSRQANEILNEYWRVWSSMYLQTLRERHTYDRTHHKKQTTLAVPQVNDVVLMEEPNQPRSKWHLGKIVKLIHGTDGSARSAHVLSSGRLLHRPMQRLYPMELANTAPSEEPTQPAPTSENHPGNITETIELSYDWDL